MAATTTAGVRKRTFGTLTSIALAAALAACGAGGDTAGSGADERTEVTIGLLPISAVAPVYMGMEQGFFAEEGIDLEVEIAQGGAAIVPAVVSEEYEFGFSNPISLFQASVKDLPVQVIANANSASDTDDPELINSFVFADEDSAIDSAEDLEGKTIAVNTLENLGHVTVSAALENNGVDPSTVEWLEVPFPDMQVALDAGRVDAIWLVEPFTTQARQAGARPVLKPYYDTQPGMTASVYFTSRQLSESDPELVDGFVRAMQRSNTFAAEHPDRLRAAVGDTTSIEPDVLEEIALPNPSPDLHVDSLRRLAELTVRYGVANEPADLDALVRDGA